MSLFGKLGGLAISAVLVGGAAAYVGSVGSSVISNVSKLADTVKCYIVRQHNGGIAVFEEGSTQPVAAFSLPAESISAADARLLEDGIRLSGVDDVLRLLEDLDIDM